MVSPTDAAPGKRVLLEIVTMPTVRLFPLAQAAGGTSTARVADRLQINRVRRFTSSLRGPQRAGIEYRPGARQES